MAVLSKIKFFGKYDKMIYVLDKRPKKGTTMQEAVPRSDNEKKAMDAFVVKDRPTLDICK